VPVTTAPLLPPPVPFVDGEFSAPELDRAEVVVNPATGAELGRVASAGSREVDAAVSAARRAADDGPWAQATPATRSAALQRLADVLIAQTDRILALVVAETGCPVTAARGHQVGIPLQHLLHWAEAARRPELIGHPVMPVRRSDGSGALGGWTVRREPCGVVAAITPYNFPFLQTVMKIGPALAAGNTVVVKPSPLTPYSTLLLAQAAQEAELPDGVLNVVTGAADVGTQLIGDPRVDVVSFTGSDRVGAAIAAVAAPRFARLILELGGKSALIVCEDADLKLAARAGAQSATYHAGQGCALTTRHLVHRAVRDRYVDLLVEAVAAVRVGDPTDPQTGMGPLIRASAVDRVDGYVRAARAAGATVAHGGARSPQPHGFFYEPTVLTGVDNRQPVAREEIFGPVVAVIDVDDDAHAVELANDSPYGLAGHVVSADPARAFALATRLRTGSVDINGGPGYTNPAVPFGGYKNSGVGRENGDQGLDEYTQFKTIKYHVG
jgi:aldehyde dehydrogenase (NAD+)